MLFKVKKEPVKVMNLKTLQVYNAWIKKEISFTGFKKNVSVYLSYTTTNAINNDIEIVSHNLYFKTLNEFKSCWEVIGWLGHSGIF